MDVDVPLGVLADAVRVPVLDRRGQLAPVVVHLVGVITGANHRALAAGLVGRVQNHRSSSGPRTRGAKRLDETPSRDGRCPARVRIAHDSPPEASDYSAF